MAMHLIIVTRADRPSKLADIGLLTRSLIVSTPGIKNCRLLHETLVEATLYFETENEEWPEGLVAMLRDRGVRLIHAERGDWVV
ncbi:hypothetical protein [Lysobacter sp. Hz 25]|uniref:hypothetical protein n=1 Tax=Lysobacter sp. Hz 25 TaxID=3383698 RepID=UPI0038D410A1